MKRLKFIWTSFFMLVAVSHVAASSAPATAADLGVHSFNAGTKTFRIIAGSASLKAAEVKYDAASAADLPLYNAVLQNVDPTQLNNAGLGLAAVSAGNGNALPGVFDPVSRRVFMQGGNGQIVSLDLNGGNAFGMIGKDQDGYILQQLEPADIQSINLPQQQAVNGESQLAIFNLTQFALARELAPHAAKLAPYERLYAVSVDQGDMKEMVNNGFAGDDFVFARDMEESKRKKRFLAVMRTRHGEIKVLGSWAKLADVDTATGKLTLTKKGKKLSKDLQEKMRALVKKN